MKLGLKRKIVLVFVAVLAVVTVLDALLASYFTKRQNQDAAFATLERNLHTWQDELQDMTLHMRSVALSAIGETVALNQLAELEVLEFKLADALSKNKNVKEAARTLAFSKTVSLNRLHLVLRSGGFSAIAVYIDGKLSHQVSVSEVGMFVQRANGKQVWVEAAADGNGNLPIRSWPAWVEGVAPVAVLPPPLDQPQVAFNYASADSMLVEVAVPVEGFIDQSLPESEINPPELSVFDSRIAGSANDPSVFSVNQSPSPFAVVVFQKRIDQAFLQAVERKTGMWPQLLSPDGRYRLQLEPLNLSVQELLPDLAEASAGIKAQTVITDQGAFYAATLLWQFERQPGFVLALMASQDSTLQNIRQTVLAILTATGLILAFSIAVGIFWLGRIINPIIALTHAVKAIGLVSRLERGRQPAYRLTAENLQPLGIHAPAEIGDLAWAFDVMIGELRHSFDTLEQRVQDRTIELLSLQQVLEKQNRQLEEQGIELSASNSSLLEEINERKLIEDLLRLREQEFRSLAENSPDNIARYDRECRMKYMNPQLHATLGITDDAAARAYLGKTSTELYPDGRSDGYEQTIKNVIATGLPAEYELEWPDTGDGVLHHLVRMVAERDQSGEVIGVLAMGRDITERKRNQQQLELLTFAIDRSDPALLVDDETIVYANQAGLNSLEYSADELIGRSIFDIVPDLTEEQAAANFRRLAEQGTFTLECRHKTKSGRVFPVEVSLTQFVYEGKSLVLALARDITERKQTQHRMELLNRAINQASESICLIDGQLRFTYVNDTACRSLGYSREQLLTMTPPDIDPDVSFEAAMAMMNSTPVGGNLSFESRNQARDGRIFPVEVSANPFEDEELKFSLIVIRDITERKQMEDALRKSEKILTEAQRIAQVGSWDWDVLMNRVEWSEMSYEIYTPDKRPAALGFDDFTSSLHPDDLERVLAAVHSAFEHDTPFDLDHRVVSASKGVRHVHAQGRVFRDANGKPVRMMGTVQDITERKRMEDVLSKSRQTLNEAQRIAHIGSWELDLVNSVLNWSDEIFRIFEINPEQFGASYEAFIDAVHPDDREAVNRVYSESLASREPYQIEHRLLMADGRIKYVLELCETDYDDDGKPLYSLGTVQDITERKRMETELASQADFQKTLINAVCDVGMQLMVIENGRMIHVANRESAKEFGFSDEELAASPSFIDFVHPDDRARVIDYHVRRQAGEAVPTSYELSLVTHKGERREYEISIAVVPGTDPVRTISISKNITERKRMEAELASQANFQQTILNAICEVGMQVMMIEEDRIIYVGNRELAREFGFTEDELNAHPPLADIIHPDDRARVMDYHARRLAGEAVPANYELGLVTRNGERREYESSVAVVPDTRPIRMISIGKDISERKGMEKALAEREQKFRAFVESSPGMAGSFYAKPDGSVCMPYVSENVWELFGFRPEEVAEDASRLLALNHPADADRVGAAIAESARTMMPWHIEYRILHPTLGERWMEGNSNPLPHPDGGIIWYGYVHDITERKQAEAEKQRLINIMEQSADFIGSADMQGNLAYHNRAALRMVGLPEDADLSGMHIVDMHPAWVTKMMQETAIPAVLEHGVWRGESAVLHRDGREIPVAQLLMLHRDSDGKPEFMATIMQDITERKQSEDEIRALNAGLELRVLERTEELRRQTRYLRTMIDTLPMMAWLKDTDSRFLVVNQDLAVAAAGTNDVDVMIGKCDLDFWPREHAEVYRVDDAEVMATGRRKTLEEPFVDANNGTIWIETFKAPVVDEDGRILGTVGVARDISDRKALETAREASLAEAERLARLRSEFMARMSHELRTPLNGILGYAQILLGESELNERQDGMVNVIRQSGDHLLNLINDILDFAKIEAGKQKLSLSDVQLTEFLHNIAGIVSVRAEQKCLAFSCDIAADVPKGICIDEMRLRQVLLNLLSNAVKYTEHGRICLEVTLLEPGRLRFKVQDSGIGIETGQLESIFRPFEQSGDSRGHVGGTGLGLVISRELVRLMGSEIFVTSRIGKGSRFWFDLDVSVVDVPGEIMPVKQQATGYRGERRRVLVVDDVDVNRVLLFDMLSHLGFETVVAANGRACLDSVEKRLPDLVLLDMVMAEMDGLEVARRLRCLSGFGQTPIIAVSASASGTDVAEAMEAGVSVFLPKPVNMKRLMAQIGGLLDLDWIYALPEAEPATQQGLDEWLEAPPLEEMKVLHHLAEEGSMRDIISRADYLAELDARYRPFAEQLQRLAKGYQSKAVLDLVEHYINRDSNGSASD
ncbi:MAG: PAS domain S-box protein [Gammaproteobacteria bacterium]